MSQTEKPVPAYLRESPASMPGHQSTVSDSSNSSAALRSGCGEKQDAYELKLTTETWSVHVSARTRATGAALCRALAAFMQEDEPT